MKKFEKELTKQRDEFTIEINKIKEKAKKTEKHKKQYDELQLVIQNLTEQNKKLQHDLSELNDKQVQSTSTPNETISQLQKELSDTTRNYNDIIELSKNKTEEINNLKEQLENEKTASNSKLKKRKEHIKKLKNDITETKNELEQSLKKDELQNISNQQTVVSTDNNPIREELDRAVKELSKEKEILTTIKESVIKEVNDAKSTLDTLAALLKEKSDKLIDEERRYKEVHAQLQVEEKTLKEIKDKLGEPQKKIIASHPSDEKLGEKLKAEIRVLKLEKDQQKEKVMELEQKLSRQSMLSTPSTSPVPSNSLSRDSGIGNSIWFFAFLGLFIINLILIRFW